MKIKLVCNSPEEAAKLYAAINDFSPKGNRAHYADWLETNGEVDRANTVRATIKAYHTLDATSIIDIPDEDNWGKMIAVPLLKYFLEGVEDFDRSEMLRFRDLVFSQLRPALSLSYSKAQNVPDIGSSYLWGQPDLPEGKEWPKIAEASDWFDAKDELPENNHCAFIGQFAFKDFSSTILGQELPSDGGFSVFSITEVYKLGVVETVIRPWDNKVILSRHNHPHDLIEDKLGDEVNKPKPYHNIELEEVLSLPDAHYHPFSDVIPNCKYEEAYDGFYSDLHQICNNNTLGLGGYLSGTSGSDPSPDIHSVRLAVLRTTPELGIVHFAIPSDDLKDGRFDRVSYVWNDWDS